MKVNSYIKLTSLIFMTLLLVGCGSTAPKQASQKVAIAPVNPIENDAPTFESELEKSQSTIDFQQQFEHLVSAINIAKANQEWRKANVTISQLLTHKELNVQQQLRLTILEAEMLYLSGDPELSLRILKEIDLQSIATLSKDQQFSFYSLASNVYKDKEMYVKALESQLKLDAEFLERLSPVEQTNLHNDLWQSLSALPEYALTTFKGRLTSRSEGWIYLSIAVSGNIGDPIKLHKAMQSWQQRFPGHPSLELLPDALQSALNVTPYASNKVVLLLQMTGRFSKETTALRDGFLSAMQDSNSELYLIDSTLENQVLAEQIDAINPDFIVGPLLSKNVDKFILSDVAKRYPNLLLNVPKTQLNEAFTDTFTFNLSRNDELKQAAKTLFEKGYKHPVIVAENNNSGKRSAQYLAEKWRELTRNNSDFDDIEITHFSGKHDMGKVIRKVLEVEESKSRIAKMKRLLNQPLITETRNRKDIDAFYIIATPVQTHLLKPFIDVSVSPFAKQIPIYASSRSHGNFKNAKVELNQVTFTEMPWLLGRHSNLQQLRDLSNTLWPDRSGQQDRLFAMGYDSFNLIEQLAQMRVLSGKAVMGLTGELSSDNLGNLNRSLSWAQYNKGVVKYIDSVQ